MRASAYLLLVDGGSADNDDSARPLVVVVGPNA